MRLTFKNIIIENFGSFRAPKTIQLDRTPGVYFVRGRNEDNPRLSTNGCGKTTIWRAVTWCLFGKTSNGLRTPDLQPWQGSTGSIVAVEMRVDELDCVIVRCSNPNEIVLNDATVTQNDIDKLLNISVEFFCNSILLPQGKDLFLDLKPSNKLQMLTDALQLERWEKRSSKAGKLTTDYENEHSKLAGELASLQRTEAQFKKLLEDARARSVEWETEQQSHAKQCDKELEDFESGLLIVRDKLGAAQLALDSAGVEAKQLKLDITKLRADVHAKQRVMDQASFEGKQLARDHTRLKDEWSSLSQAKTCPTCGQPIKQNNIEKHKTELRAALEELNQAIAANQLTLGTLEGPLVALSAQLDEAEKHYKTFEEKETAAQLIVSHYLPKEATLVAGITALRVKMQTEQSNPYTEQTHKLRQQVSKAEVDITSCDKDIAAVLKDVELTKFWIKGFKDVTLYILEEVLQEIELACNTMLPDVGLDGWEMHFNVERETQSGSIQRGLTVSVLSPDNDKPVRWECWSGGEAQRLRVIGALAVSEVLLNYAGVTSNLEVLDEPTQHLSPEGTDDLCTFLASRAKQLNIQTWWIDHSIVETSLFNKVLTVVKDKNGSRLEEAA